jgi:hypothetical protein
VRSKNTGRFRRRNTAGAMSANQGCDDESSDADSAAKGRKRSFDTDWHAKGLGNTLRNPFGNRQLSTRNGYS